MLYLLVLALANLIENKFINGSVNETNNILLKQERYMALVHWLYLRGKPLIGFNNIRSYMKLMVSRGFWGMTVIVPVLTGR